MNFRPLRTCYKNNACELTPNTYSKLNMDDVSVLTGLLEYLDSTQEVELKSLHAQTWIFLILNFVIWGTYILAKPECPNAFLIELCTLIIIF